jgi:hypothetical protein
MEVTLGIHGIGLDTQAGPAVLLLQHKCVAQDDSVVGRKVKECATNLVLKDVQNRLVLADLKTPMVGGRVARRVQRCA